MGLQKRGSGTGSKPWRKHGNISENRHSTPPSPPLSPNHPKKEIMFEEWANDWLPLPTTDPHRHFGPFTEPPSADFHPWVRGILSVFSQKLQSTAFQIITSHTFEADYSDRFRPTAGDRTDCPFCSERYTIKHVFLECGAYQEERLTLYNKASTLHKWFRNYKCRKRTAKFLHLTQALNKPLPPVPEQEPPEPP
jgi:hypothetical protein